MHFWGLAFRNIYQDKFIQIIIYMPLAVLRGGFTSWIWILMDRTEKFDSVTLGPEWFSQCSEHTDLALRKHTFCVKVTKYHDNCR